MLKRTPFYSQHEALGARFVPFGGWEMPVQYGAGLKTEHERVRTSVGLFDVSHMGEIRVSGPRAADALMYLLSNDVASVAIGQAQYNVMCNERGGVVDDVVVYRLGETDFMVCVNASNRDKDHAWIVEHNPHPEEAVIDNQSDEWVQVAIQGPKSRDVLARLTDLDLAPLENYRFAMGTVAGVDGCIVARTGYTGEYGFEVFAPAVQGAGLFTAMLEAGEPEGILPIGLGARDTLRLEVRYCLYGHELSDELSPLQARLGWVTKLDKPGGFLGRDAIVARRKTDTHFLAGVLLDGRRIAREGMRVLRDGEDVGWVTSGTRGPSVDRGVCLVYVRRPNGRPGTQLTVDVRGREASGVVVKGPFYSAS